VPDSLQTPAANARRNVVLLEEYDALSAALGAALKKFAPEHAIAVANALAEAESLAAKADPELFVIDADPPWMGITDFLDKMRDLHPRARTLVIGAPIPADIATERRLSGALQFLEKPFELPAFGAAVQALLGSWRESESTGPRGSLGALNAIDIVLLHYAASATVIVDVRAGKTGFGEIHFCSGQISHAEAGRLVGLDALREILAWPEPLMSERPGAAVARRTIERGWSDVVLETLRKVKSTRAVRPRRAAEAPIAHELQPAKKIVVIDDTEMLLVFVEDVLTTADLTLQVTTAKNGKEGLESIRAVMPDLVLLDYNLPDLDGAQVCRRLMQDAHTARIRVVMMSAHGAEMTAAAANLQNVVASIEKPFFSTELLRLIQRVLTEPRVQVAGKPALPVISTPAAAPQLRPVARPPQVKVTADGKEAVLGLFLEVVSLQFTPQLQMGSIRARPAPGFVSLHLASPELQNSIPPRVGFNLGTTELDAAGRISVMHLVPSAKPFRAAQTRNIFEIASVAVIPADARQRVQLTPTGSAPMTVELIAHLKLAGVKLAPTFQVAQLTLRWRTNVVRVTLNPKAPEATAARFEITGVTLNEDRQLAELVLDPVK
jgi:DNA-binding response OmpR family regulator